MCRAVEVSGFACPIYISALSSFGGLGRFPSSMEFRAFLLGGRGGIMTMNGPVRGPGVESLFLGVVSNNASLPSRGHPRARIGVRALSVSLNVFS